jgi:periplasmic protein TonB
MTHCGREGFADGAASRPLLVALAASVALHAALVAGLPDLWAYSTHPAAAPLNARIAPGGRVVTVPEPSPVGISSADPLPDRGGTPPERPAPSRRSAVAAPTPTPVPPAPPKQAMLEPSPVAEPVLAPGTPTLAPRPGADALEAGSLAQYRIALIGAAKRLKHYPAPAIDRGVEGRVDVRLVIGADGAPAAVVVARSSGHEVLDRQAVETMRRATADTPIPPALRNREIVVEIPLLYELKGAS